MPNASDSIGARLKAAIAAAGLSVRGVAKLLAPEDASDQDVERERRQLHRWLADEHAPEPENAERLGEVLGRDPAEFMGGRRSRAANLSTLHAKVDEIRDLLGEAERLAFTRAGEAPPEDDRLVVLRRLAELADELAEQRGQLTAMAAETHRIADLLSELVQQQRADRQHREADSPAPAERPGS